MRYFYVFYQYNLGGFGCACIECNGFLNMEATVSHIQEKSNIAGVIISNFIELTEHEYKVFTRK